VNDEENKETSEDVTPEDEGLDPTTTGPVAEDDSTSSQAAGEDSSSTPPVDEAPEAEQPQDEAPEADESQADAEETPADPGSEAEESAADGPDTTADTPQPEPEPEAEPEAKKDKKDVIPGADLEPIAVEQAERPLSAEERARKEAEDEERAKREAALTGEGSEEEDVASRAPAKMESGARFIATGKRKRAIARVIVLPGNGKIEVNQRTLEEFFPRPLHQTMATQPLAITGYEGNVDVRVRVHGGGIGGQAGAIRHGIARALTEIDPELRGELKRRGFLTRDARVKERRKAGLKKARKRPQFSKR
jgi:small subunit ribosomal protein S9